MVFLQEQVGQPSRGEGDDHARLDDPARQHIEVVLRKYSINHEDCLHLHLDEVQ